MEIKVNATSIETCLWAIEYYLMRKYGTDIASRDIYALKWYINTGRATTDFLRLLIHAKPFMVARILHKAPTDSEAIESIKKYIGYAD